jgi:hypothetical protein
LYLLLGGVDIDNSILQKEFPPHAFLGFVSRCFRIVLFVMLNAIADKDVLHKSAAEQAVLFLDQVSVFRSQVEEAVATNAALPFSDTAPIPVPARTMHVSMRKRPLLPHEVKALGTTGQFHDPEYDSVTVCDPFVYTHSERLLVGGVQTGEMKHDARRLHASFGPADDNRAVYSKLEAFLGVESTIAAGNGATRVVIAYGQTGAGKTFTQVAVQQFLAADVLAAVADAKEGEVEVRVSYFEIAGKKTLDLLNARGECTMRTDSDGEIVVAGLTTRVVANLAEFDEALAAGNALRATHATQNNDTSSRSHAICSIIVTKPHAEQEQEQEPQEVTEETEEGQQQQEKQASSVLARFRVVDLAGSERSENMHHHSQERIDEMTDINYSLACLKECTRLSLEAQRTKLRRQERNLKPSTKPTFIPFRRSNLTMFLKACFDDQSTTNKTAFLAHVNPMASSWAHTKSTLEYTYQLLAVEATIQERKKAKADPKKTVQLPKEWGKKKFVRWLSALDDGRFMPIMESMQMTGRAFAGTYVAMLLKRVQIAGGSEEDGERIYKAFWEETKRLTDKQRALRSAGKKRKTQPAAVAAKEGGNVANVAEKVFKAAYTEQQKEEKK